MRHDWQIQVTQCLDCQKDDGATEVSVKLVGRHRRELANLAYVEMMMPGGENYGEALIRFIGANGSYVQVDGLAWGYGGGDGPRGLETSLKLFDIVIPVWEILRWKFEHGIMKISGTTTVSRCAC